MSEVDKRHGDPEYGGLTSGEKATLTRGQTPKSIEGDPDKEEGAQRYLAEHHKESKGHGATHAHTSHKAHEKGEIDKRHGDPEYGGLTSGEKATLSRGQTPKSIEGDPEKEEAAQRYLEEHHKSEHHSKK